MVYVTLQPTINFRVILLATLHRVVQNHWTGKKPALVFYFLIFIALPGRKTNWFSRVIVVVILKSRSQILLQKVQNVKKIYRHRAV